MTDGRAVVPATVVICAYTLDRWNDLTAGLAAVAGQSVRPQATVVVIDHNPDLLERLSAHVAATGLDVTVVPNARRQGLSGARNTAIGLSTTDLIAFLDDDAKPQPEWLEALTAPFDDPAVQVTGGRSRPAWPQQRPAWFPEEFDWVVGSTYKGMPEHEAPVRNVHGSSMAFRRTVFDEVGLFDEDLGRVGTLPVGCEETELCIRITQYDPATKIVYVPGSLIDHRVTPVRTTLKYFVRRCYSEGISKAQISRLVGAADATSAERSYVGKTLPRGVGRAVGASVTGRPAALLRAGTIVLGLAMTTLGFLRSRLGQTAAPAPAGNATGLAGRPEPRIAMVTARTAPELGGTESHVTEVSARLAAAWPGLVVLATDRSGTLAPRDQVADVSVRRFRAYPRGRDYYFSPGLVRAIRRGRYDLVHLQGVHTLVAPLAMLTALRHHVPYVVTFHTGGSSSGLRSRLRGLQFALLAPLLRRASALIAVSRFEAELFQKVLGATPGRIRVVRNGGSLPPLPSEGVEKPDCLVVSSGRLEHYKGHHRVLEAVPYLLTTHPQAQVRILGSGPYETQLRAIAARLGIRDRVSIYQVPPQDRPAMARELSRASVVTLLSDYESQGIAVMEALSLGVPAVVLSDSALRELVEDRWAVGVDPGATAEQVADAIRLQLQDPVLPALADIPTWQTCADQLSQIYRDVLGIRASEPTVATNSSMN